MTDTNQTFKSTDPDLANAIARATSTMATRDKGTRTIPVTVTIDDQPGKSVWTFTVAQRIGVKRHMITVLHDPFTN